MSQLPDPHAAINARKWINQSFQECGHSSQTWLERAIDIARDDEEMLRGFLTLAFYYVDRELFDNAK